MIARHLTNSDKMITMTEEDDDVDQGSSLLIDEDANHIDDDDSGTLQETRREVAELRDSLTYLTHQVYRILLALHVPACQCEICADKHKSQNDLIIQSTKLNNDSNTDLGRHVPNQLQRQQQSAELLQSTTAATVTLSGDMNGIEDHPPAVASAVDCNALLSQLFPATNNVATAHHHLIGEPRHYSGRGRPPLGVSAHSAVRPYVVGGGGVPGRKSKYCTAAEKKAVADYAAKFGASAAARKYNIPPAVAAYYHRKEHKQTLPKGRRASYALTDDSTTTTLVDNNAAAVVDDGPGAILSDRDDSCSNGDWKLDDDDRKLSPNGATVVTGSPTASYLRGRGRGRPKLIGDELDAELVDYMVQVKLRSDQHRIHMTASQALLIARDYIQQKAPGLLDEDGGQIKLKLTWAMKLCARVAERQRELYPPPSISTSSACNMMMYNNSTISQMAQQENYNDDEDDDDDDDEEDEEPTTMIGANDSEQLILQSTNSNGLSREMGTV